jgi:hypothetical protein
VPVRGRTIVDGCSEYETRAHAVTNVRLSESAGDRLLGSPTGAMRAHHESRLEFGKVRAYSTNQRLEHRPVQVKATHPRPPARGRGGSLGGFASSADDDGLNCQALVTPLYRECYDYVTDR